MSVYTVHEPPLLPGEASADPERFAFVRDGFYLWAFLLTPLWMLWRRMWLVFVIAIALVAVVDAAAILLGASSAMVFVINALISLLVGIEARHAAALDAGAARLEECRHRRRRRSRIGRAAVFRHLGPAGRCAARRARGGDGVGCACNAGDAHAAFA